MKVVNSILKRILLVFLANICLTGMMFSQDLIRDGIIREPWLQISTPRSVVVKWITERGIEGTLSYGKTVNALNMSVKEPEERIYHEIKIEGLDPATKYYYSVTAPAKGSDEQYFITPPESGSGQTVRIWVISDFGQTDSRDNPRRQETVEQWKEFNGGNYHANLILSLGDQSEDDAIFQIQHNYFSTLDKVLVNSPLYTLIGNHDDHDSVKNYLKTFTLPSSGEAGGFPSGTEKYYSFDYANVHVIMLCTEVSDEELVAETEWLRKDLGQNRKEWLIAAMHQPLHSAGYHPTDDNEWAQTRRNEWLTLLEDNGVDLILQGHNHVYERSLLVDNITGKSTDVKSTNILDSGLGKEKPYRKPAGNKPHKGTIFITCTGGGVANAPKHYPAPYSFIPVRFPGSDYEGSLVIDVDRNKMNVKFLCNEADSTGNHVWDNFTIIKN